MTLTEEAQADLLKAGYKEDPIGFIQSQRHKLTDDEKNFIDFLIGPETGETENQEEQSWKPKPVIN